MNGILKIIAGILVTLILGQVLSRQGKDMTLLLILAVTGMIFTAAVTYLEEIVDFIEKLQFLGEINSQTVSILMKSMGIGLLTEIVILICNDMGYSALGKALQIIASAVILWLSIPIFSQMLDLLQRVTEAI